MSVKKQRMSDTNLMFYSRAGRWMKLIAPALSAVLFSLCFHPYNIWGLAFVAFVPLLLATVTSKNSLQARGNGFVFGVLFYSFTLRWFWDILPWFCILLWGILAIFT